MNDNSFGPATVRIAKGGTVTWNWAGKNEHQVAAQGSFSARQTSGSFSATFSQAGEFPYVCTVHAFSGMTGTVIVE